MNKKNYNVIGVMSGTSLDGLDLAFCTIQCEGNTWSFNINEAISIPYSSEWEHRLTEAHKLSGQELVLLDKNYGEYMGNTIQSFIAQHHLSPDLIASHGHTIFHQPEESLTYQLGDGRMIYTATGIPTVFDFRSLDVALKGEGAPLVPIGDRLLFSDFQYCLNLGGIANISFEQGKKRIAFDICPANMILNYLSSKLGFSYDAQGEIASKGTTDQSLLNELNNISFYRSPAPKSLGREWFEKEFLSFYEVSETSIPDLLRTSVEHITDQIATVINSQAPEGKMLVTGGGAHNSFLIELLSKKTAVEIHVPDQQVIDYKEALVFGLLGVLNIRGEINTLSSVTGAVKDSIGGVYIS